MQSRIRKGADRRTKSAPIRRPPRCRFATQRRPPPLRMINNVSALKAQLRRRFSPIIALQCAASVTCLSLEQIQQLLAQNATFLPEDFGISQPSSTEIEDDKEAFSVRFMTDFSYVNASEKEFELLLAGEFARQTTTDFTELFCNAASFCLDSLYCDEMCDWIDFPMGLLVMHDESETLETNKDFSLRVGKFVLNNQNCCIRHVLLTTKEEFEGCSNILKMFVDASCTDKRNTHAKLLVKQFLVEHFFPYYDEFFRKHESVLGESLVQMSGIGSRLLSLSKASLGRLFGRTKSSDSLHPHKTESSAAASISAFKVAKRLGDVCLLMHDFYGARACYRRLVRTKATLKTLDFDEKMCAIAAKATLWMCDVVLADVVADAQYFYESFEASWLQAHSFALSMRLLATPLIACLLEAPFAKQVVAFELLAADLQTKGDACGGAQLLLGAVDGILAGFFERMELRRKACHFFVGSFVCFGRRNMQSLCDAAFSRLKRLLFDACRAEDDFLHVAAEVLFLDARRKQCFESFVEFCCSKGFFSFPTSNRLLAICAHSPASHRFFVYSDAFPDVQRVRVLGEANGHCFICGEVFKVEVWSAALFARPIEWFSDFAVHAFDPEALHVIHTSVNVAAATLLFECRALKIGSQQLKSLSFVLFDQIVIIAEIGTKTLGNDAFIVTPLRPSLRHRLCDFPRRAFIFQLFPFVLRFETGSASFASPVTLKLTPNSPAIQIATTNFHVTAFPHDVAGLVFVNSALFCFEICVTYEGDGFRGAFTVTQDLRLEKSLSLRLHADIHADALLCRLLGSDQFKIYDVFYQSAFHGVRLVEESIDAFECSVTLDSAAAIAHQSSIERDFDSLKVSIERYFRGECDEVRIAEDCDHVTSAIAKASFTSLKGRAFWNAWEIFGFDFVALAKVNAIVKTRLPTEILLVICWENVTEACVGVIPTIVQWGVGMRRFMQHTCRNLTVAPAKLQLTNTRLDRSQLLQTLRRGSHRNALQPPVSLVLRSVTNLFERQFSLLVDCTNLWYERCKVILELHDSPGLRWIGQRSATVDDVPPLQTRPIKAHFVHVPPNDASAAQSSLCVSSWKCRVLTANGFEVVSGAATKDIFVSAEALHPA